MITLINSLGSTLTLPVTMSYTDTSYDYKVDAERLTGDGAVFTGKSLEPRAISLEGSLYYKTPASNQAKIDELNRFLRYSPIEIDRGDGRRIKATPQSHSYKWLDGGVEVEAKLGLIAHDPYFYGTPQEFSKTVSGADAIAMAPDGEGYPVITLTITGSCTDPTLTLGAQVVAIAGTYASGVIRLDCAKMLATYNGAGIIGAMNDAWLANSLIISYDDSSMAFTATGSYSIDVKIELRPRYL
jgi:phage-related protein